MLNSVCLGCPLLVGFQENELLLCLFFFFSFALQMCSTNLPSLPTLMSALYFQSNPSCYVTVCVCVGIWCCTFKKDLCHLLWTTSRRVGNTICEVPRGHSTHGLTEHVRSVKLKTMSAMWLSTLFLVSFWKCSSTYQLTERFQGPSKVSCIEQILYCIRSTEAL